MTTMKGPAIFLAQFAGDEAPFNSLDAICAWAASHGYEGVQIPSWDARLFDLARAAESEAYCDEVKGVAAAHGLAVKQMGDYVARVIARRLAGQPGPAPFRYKDWGNLATIGRKRAVADFGWARMRGAWAWLFWCVAHVFFLVGFRNRLIVGANWLWQYVTFGRGARLITGLDHKHATAMPTIVPQDHTRQLARRA